MLFDPSPSQESLRRSAEAVAIALHLPLNESLGAVRALGLRAAFTGVGAPRDTVGYLAALAELAVRSTTLALAVHDDALFFDLVASQDGPQKSIDGEKFGCIGLGSITNDQDGLAWLLNGRAKLVTNASLAEQMIVLSDSSARGESPRAFVLNLPASGVRRVEASDSLGSVLELSNASAHTAFGDERTTRRFFAGARLGVAATAVGLARRTLRASVRLLKERGSCVSGRERPARSGPSVPPGPPLASLGAAKRRASGPGGSIGQAASFALSDMATEIDAAWLVTLEAAGRRDAGAAYEAAAAEAKHLSCPTACRVVQRAAQITGASAVDPEIEHAAAVAQCLSRAATTDAEDIETIASELLEEA